MRTVKVEASSKTYDVIIGRGLFSDLGEYIRSVLGTARLCVVTDTNVDRLYGERLAAVLERSDFVKFVIEAGEKSKCIATWSALLNFLAENSFDRGDAIVAFGGGVVGDLAGFAASAYMRGIRFVQVPTTLLAAVDSSVGGKTAVDLDGGKNLCGCFWQPEAVLCDPDMTDTLPPEVFADGMGEVIKYVFLSEKLSPDMLLGDIHENLEDIITACVEIKRDIVNADERDTGCRALLNLGHTAAHAIEKLSEYKISHGAAVAQGLVIAARGAAHLGVCNASVPMEVSELLAKNGIGEKCPFSAAELASAAMGDKKKNGKNITLILPERTGHSVLHPISTDGLEAFFAAGLEE